MFSHLVLQIEQQYPLLRSEYIQVLLLVVCPLLLLLGVILLNLKFGQGVVVNGAETTFRPSIAVRCSWIFVAVALVGNAIFSAGTKHIAGTGYFLAVAHLLLLFELLRAFPSDVTIRSDGIRWRTLWAPVDVQWEKIYCFVKKRSFPGAEEYRLCGIDGQTLELSRIVHPISKRSGSALRLSSECATSRRAVLNLGPRSMLFTRLLRLLP
jgi:hypothetical protein